MSNVLFFLFAFFTGAAGALALVAKLGWFERVITVKPEITTQVRLDPAQMEAVIFAALARRPLPPVLVDWRVVQACITAEGYMLVARPPGRDRAQLSN